MSRPMIHPRDAAERQRRTALHAELDAATPPAWLWTVPEDILHRGSMLVRYVERRGLPRPSLIDVAAARRQRRSNKIN